MGQNEIPMTKKRIKFLKTYSDLDDSEILKELEKIRSNTSMLVWWLIAIPIIFFIIIIFFGGLGALI